MTGCRSTLVAGALCASLPAGHALAGGYQLIPGVFATDLSADGSVLVGNAQGTFETFRWTQATGVDLLGRGTVVPLGVGAGLPGVSADGTQISATILDDAGTAATVGRWTLGSGWQQLMPPTLPGGGVIDQSYGSAWGISGDGNTVSGLYWLTTGRANALRWVEGQGLTSLGAAGGRNSRANGVNFDGTVIVGWDEHPTFGVRRAAIWENGVVDILAPENGDAPTEVTKVTPDGTVAVGQDYDYVNFLTVAAIWRNDGDSWEVQQLGTLDGTGGNNSGAFGNDISADGTFVVGTNRFGGFGPPPVGFIWTEELGMVDVNAWLPTIGVIIDPTLSITGLIAISDDGRTIAGTAENINTFEAQAILITIPEPASGLVLGLLSLPLLARRRR